MSETVPPMPPADLPPEATSGATVPAPKKKKRRRWLVRLLIALPILLVLFVLLLPTLLSLGVVRSMLLPAISRLVAPNGKLDVAAWKLGWFGGQRLDNVQLLDADNAVVAHLNVKTDATLWSLVRGNYDLGDTTVNGDFDIRVDPSTGRVNALHIVGVDPKSAGPAEPKPSPEPGPKPGSPPPAKPADKPSPLPIDLAKVKGKVTVNLVGTVSASNGDAKSIPFTKITTGTLLLDLNDLEHGLPIEGRLQLVVNDNPALLTIKGTADAIENNVVVTDPNHISADLVAGIDQLDLSIVKAALAAVGVENVDVAGILKGRVTVDIKPGGAASIRSDDSLGIDNLVVTAPQLKGDTFASKRVAFPLNISRAAGSDDVKIEALGVVSDVATLNVTGTLSQRAVQNLAGKKAPGAPSQIIVRVDIPTFAALSAMLPHVTQRPPGVEITGGGLSERFQIDITPDGLKATQALELAVSGTADGKPIKIDKTKLDASADLAIRDGQPIDQKSVRTFALSVVAPFANVSGGGVPEKIQLAGNVDLTRLSSDVAQFVDLGKLVLKGTANFKLNTSGLPTGPDVFGSQVNFVASGLSVANAGATYLDNENVKGDVNLLLKQTDTTRLITFRKLNIGTDSGLFGLWTAGDDAWVSVTSGVPTSGEGEFHLRGKLERLLAPFLSSADPSMQLKRGLLDTTVAFAFDGQSNGYKVTSDVGFSKLDVGDVLSNESLKLTSDALIPTDLSAAKATFGVVSGFVTMKGAADLRLKDAKGESAGTFEMARDVHFDGEIPSVQKLYALASSMSAATAKPAGPAAIPLPPLKVEAGSVAFNGRLTRDDAKHVTAIVLNVPGVNGLALSRGTDRFVQSKPITFALAADVTNDPSKPATATVKEQLVRVLVSKLEGELPGIAKLSMPQAIELTNLSQPTPTAQGVVRIEAQTEPLGQMLLVVNGSNPLPVAGTFTSDQRIATNDNSVSLTGTGRLAGIRPLGPDAKPLPERLQTVALTDDLSADLKAMSATIRKFELVAPDARDVLSVSATGTVRDLGTKNTLDGDGLTAKLSYDLAQLWPLAQPFVDPTGQSIGKIDALAGKYEKTFKVTGSYPSVDAKGVAVAFKDAIRSLAITGDVQLDRANLVDKGVDVSDLAVPFTLKGGVATIAYADGTLPKPFKANSGDGNLGGLSVDLTADEPILGNVNKHRLLTNATINPVLSNALGKFFNPIFPNATRASGLVSMTLTAQRLRLGKSLFTPDSGAATVVLSLTKMEISNPLGEQLFGGLINQGAGFLKIGGIDTKEFSNFRGEMRDATFTLDKGIVTQNATFMIGNIDGRDDEGKPKLYPFSFTGDVRLADQRMNLAAGLPMQMLKKKLGGDFAQYLPDSLPVSFTGTTTKPKIDFSKDAQKMFADAGLKLGADKLLGGGKSDGGKNDAKAGDGKKSDADKINDVIDGIFGGGDKSDGKSDDGKSKDDAPKKKKKKD